MAIRNAYDKSTMTPSDLISEASFENVPWWGQGDRHVVHLKLAQALPIQESTQLQETSGNCERRTVKRR